MKIMLNLNKIYDKILFDMDGTLVDSRAVVERHLQNWASKNKLDVNAILQAYHGRRTIDIVREFVSASMDADAEAAILEASELSDVDGIRAVAGASSLLARLLPSDWAVVTSASRELAIRRLAAAKLPMPNVLISADDVQNGKPDPEGYNRAAASLGTVGQRCLIFEDAPTGIAAAIASGGDVIAIRAASGIDFDLGCPSVEDFNHISFYVGGRNFCVDTVK